MDLAVCFSVEKFKPRSARGRKHISPSSLQKAFKDALGKSRIAKNASPQSLRHSFSTHLLQDDYDIRAIQKLLGHKELSTTINYTHILNPHRLGARSPVDLQEKAKLLSK